MNDKNSFSNAQQLRKKAEERLKANQKTDPLIIEADEKRLLHELQVHQIELEMQNDELRRANELTEAALKKFTMLYDFAPMGYFTLDQNGSIQDLNFTAAEILGDKRFSLLNSNFRLFISPASLPAFNDFFTKIFANNTKESCQLQLGYEGTPLCPVYMEGIVTGEENNCLVSILDISGFVKT